jgi:cytochrome c553
MDLRRYCGMAFTAALGLGFNVFAMAQESATPAEVTAAPEAQAAQVTQLADANAPAQPGDAKAGESKAAVCTACHGSDGNSPVPMYPKLAGQSEAYIARQLALFKDGSRVDPIMVGFASVLSSQDMNDLGAFFASQSVTPGIADDSVIAEGPNADKKFFEVGQKLYRGGDTARGIPACMACHGPTGRGNPGVPYPAIGGQHATYTALHLNGFRAGTAWGRDDELNTIMVDVAKQLTDEEIQALASYIEGLHGANATTAP